MIAQKMLLKLVVGQVMKAIEKASDKRIASDHEKRIVKLENLLNSGLTDKRKNKVEIIPIKTP